MNSSLPKPTCGYCNSPLHGRIDMKFCNDTCRNTYNREKRVAERVIPHQNAAEIFKIIKKNYAILKTGFPALIEEDESSFCDIADLLKTGYNPKFFTSTFADKSGDDWMCVFDRCICLGGQYAVIKDFPEQAEL